MDIHVVLLPNEMRRAQRQEDAKRRYGLYTEIMDTNTSNEKLFHKLIRDQPFNLQGGLWFFVSFRIFFSDNTRVRIFFFVAPSAIFFPEFNIRLYDKNSESDYFFSSTKIRIFF